MAGLLNELERLKLKFNGRFIATKEVRYEVIEKPLEIKRFELQALQIKKLFNNKTIELPEEVGVESKEISEKTQKIMNIGNSILVSKNTPVQIIGKGEASSIALYKILNQKGYNCILAMDERTTRVLIEKPENLKELMEKRLHSSVTLKYKELDELKNVRIVRSTELMYLAYKKGLIDFKGDNLVDALMWGLKTKGCAISQEEIEEIKGLR